MKASDITPEAATKKERKVAAMIQARDELLAKGQEVTQTAISAIVGCSQQLVSQYLPLLGTLLDDFNSKTSKTSQPPPDPEETQWMSTSYLPLLAQSPPLELLEGVLNTFLAYGQRVFKAIWDAAPATAQIQILSSLMLTLPQDELLALAAALGVDF